MDIAWQKWVRDLIEGRIQHRLEEAFGLLGAEFGKHGKAEHELMVKHVDEQAELLRKLISIEHGKLEARIDGQRHAIEALTERVRGLEALIGAQTKAPADFSPIGLNPVSASKHVVDLRRRA